MSSSFVLSNGDNDVKIKSIIGFPEAQDEEQTEQTGSWEAPVEPRELFMVESQKK